MACWIVKFYLLKNEDIGRTFGSRQDLLTFFIDSSSFEKEALITDFM
jgi:hypothetical protein